MFSQIPVDLSKVNKKDIDKEILRAAIMAEFDAISFYEQLFGMAENSDIKEVLLDIIKEEKTHVGEFQTLLLKEDKDQEEELSKGRNEVKELLEG
jgi:rubrerythrin